MVSEVSGDCATDVIAYQPGGALNRNAPTDTTAYWRWCPTAANPVATTCSNPSVVSLMYRNYTPLPGMRISAGNERYVAAFGSGRFA